MTPTPRRVAVLVVLAAVSALVSIAVAPSTATAQSDPAQELVDRYAPIVMVKAQDGECDTDGEQYAPSSVDIVLDNPQIVLRQLGTHNPVMTAGPGADDLFDLGEGFYLDFPGDALAPGCTYEKDFQRYSGDRRAAVYAHIARQDDRPDQLAVQYWFYWYYNDWNNKHESDWEGIQVLFDVGTVDEALATEPVSVGYAQHEGGERADWDSAKLDRQGTRPVVYSSRGSHASYFGSALYLGRSGAEGFGCDNTDGPSTTVDPEVVLLPDTVEDPADPLAWVAFTGRWGERQSGAFNGPTGPITKERWTAPVDWHDQLRSSSVTVPGGDGVGATVVGAFCNVVEFGSRQLITLKQRPAALAIVVVLLVLLIRSLYRRTDWALVDPLPIVRRRRAGQLMRAAVRLYTAHPRQFATVGLLYLPIVFAVAAVLALVGSIPLFRSLLESEADLGFVGFLFTLVFATLGHSIGVVFIRAVIAFLLDGLGRDESTTASEAFHKTPAHLHDLLAALARAVVIVAVLMISVVGIPWAFRQLVRYQFLSETTTLERLSGKAALDRSSALVRGRWFHTAVVLISINAIVFVCSMLVGLLLLIVAAGIPLWLFSVIVTVFAGLVAPYTAIAATLLYGDARAQLESRTDVPEPALTPNA